MTSTVQTTPTPYRAMREALRPKVSQRELSRRAGINSGRLSIIERGVTPTPDEHAVLTRILGELLTGAKP